MIGSKFSTNLIEDEAPIISVAEDSLEEINMDPIKRLEGLVDQLALQLDEAAEFIVTLGTYAPVGSEDKDVWIPVMLEEIEEKLWEVEDAMGRAAED